MYEHNGKLNLATLTGNNFFERLRHALSWSVFRLICFATSKSGIPHVSVALEMRSKPLSILIIYGLKANA